MEFHGGSEVFQRRFMGSWGITEGFQGVHEVLQGEPRVIERGTWKFQKRFRGSSVVSGILRGYLKVSRLFQGVSAGS